MEGGEGVKEDRDEDEEGDEDEDWDGTCRSEAPAWWEVVVHTMPVDVLVHAEPDMLLSELAVWNGEALQNVVH